MASGFGLKGGRGRCFPFWEEFMKCYGAAEHPEDCRLAFEDYQECLYHRKEVARAQIIDQEYEKKKAAGELPPSMQPRTK